MDIDRLMKAFAEQGEQDRAKYHVTLGRLIEKLSACDAGLPVVTSDGYSIGNPHSYRGYYSDLAFECVGPQTVEGVLGEARGALGHTFCGWKGGDFRMHEKTPLWVAAEGCCGVAIVDVLVQTDKVTLVTKNVDE